MKKEEVPPPEGLALVSTALGWCGVAWGPQGLRGIQLPEADRAATLARLMTRFPGMAKARPPTPVARLLDELVAHFRGERPAPTSGFSAILDWSKVPPFHRRVYEAAQRIPPGETRSYGELAAAVGSPGAARAVGQAMRRNPFPVLVPCHRVLAAGGKVGGFTAHGGTATKRRMLALEKRPERLGQGGAGDVPVATSFAEALDHLRRVDSTLGEVIARIGPCGLALRPTKNLFAALAQAIVYQQLHGKAAAAIFGRLEALFPPKEGPTAAAFLRLREEDLRAAGLSRGKLAALRDLAAKCLDGSLPRWEELDGLDDETIIDRLTEVRGIGRWTVEMLLIFRLGRMDVLPLDDFGVRRGYTVAFRKRKPVTPKQLAQAGARWSPYRSVASWYLWRAAEAARSPPSRSKP
jgi:methylated-DNA-[protein]-cysteine S-methyltransferase